MSSSSQTSVYAPGVDISLSPADRGISPGGRVNIYAKKDGKVVSIGTAEATRIVCEGGRSSFATKMHCHDLGPNLISCFNASIYDGYECVPYPYVFHTTDMFPKTVGELKGIYFSWDHRAMTAVGGGGDENPEDGQDVEMDLGDEDVEMAEAGEGNSGQVVGVEEVPVEEVVVGTEKRGEEEEQVLEVSEVEKQVDEVVIQQADKGISPIASARDDVGVDVQLEKFNENAYTKVEVKVKLSQLLDPELPIRDINEEHKQELEEAMAPGFDYSRGFILVTPKREHCEPDSKTFVNNALRPLSGHVYLLKDNFSLEVIDGGHRKNIMNEFAANPQEKTEWVNEILRVHLITRKDNKPMTAREKLLFMKKSNNDSSLVLVDNDLISMLESIRRYAKGFEQQVQKGFIETKTSAIVADLIASRFFGRQSTSTYSRNVRVGKLAVGYEGFTADLRRLAREGGSAVIGISHLDDGTIMKCGRLFIPYILNALDNFLRKSGVEKTKYNGHGFFTTTLNLLNGVYSLFQKLDRKNYPSFQSVMDAELKNVGGSMITIERSIYNCTRLYHYISPTMRKHAQNKKKIEDREKKLLQRIKNRFATELGLEGPRKRTGGSEDKQSNKRSAPGASRPPVPTRVPAADVVIEISDDEGPPSKKMRKTRARPGSGLLEVGLHGVDIERIGKRSQVGEAAGGGSSAQVGVGSARKATDRPPLPSPARASRGQAGSKSRTTKTASRIEGPKKVTGGVEETVSSALEEVDLEVEEGARPGPGPVGAGAGQKRVESPAVSTGGVGGIDNNVSAAHTMSMEGGADALLAIEKEVGLSGAGNEGVEEEFRSTASPAVSTGGVGGVSNAMSAGRAAKALQVIEKLVGSSVAGREGGEEEDSCTTLPLKELVKYCRLPDSLKGDVAENAPDMTLGSLLQTVFLSPTHRASQFMSVEDVLALGKIAHVFGGYYKRKNLNLCPPNSKNTLEGMLGEKACLSMAFFGEKAEEVKHRGYCILDNFACPTVLDGEEVDIKLATDQDFLYSIENHGKLMEEVFKTYPGTEKMKSAENQKLWTPIFTKAVESMDDKINETGVVRVQSSYDLVNQLPGNLNWVARRRTVQDVWIGWLCSLMNLDEGGKYRIQFPDHGCRYLYTPEGAMRQVGHQDFPVNAEKGHGYFVITTSDKPRPLYVCESSHKFVFYTEEDRLLDMAHTLVLEKIIIPPNSVFIGHGYLQHAGAEGDNNMCDHKYLPPVGTIITDQVFFAYGWSLAVKGEPMDRDDDEDFEWVPPSKRNNDGVIAPIERRSRSKQPVQEGSQDFSARESVGDLGANVDDIPDE